MPFNADGDTESVSIFKPRRVKIMVIWLSKPTVFSEKTVMVYNVFSIFSIIYLNYSTIIRIICQLLITQNDISNTSTCRHHRVNHSFFLNISYQ